MTYSVSAFLRVLNADENARLAIDLISRAKNFYESGDRERGLYLAKTEIEDALEVLNGGNLHFVDAILLFKESRRLINRGRLNKAINKLNKTREKMFDRSGV